MANFDITTAFLIMLPKLKIALFSLCLLICSIFIGWASLAQVNFGYKLLHPVMGIDEHIEKYGPQNRYRKGFEKTDKAEQERLFAAITYAIHNQGEGLNDLVYHDTNGRPIRRLLRHPEVVHLKDVANLVDVFYWVSVVAALILFGLIAHYAITQSPLPSIKQQVIGILGFSAITFIIVMAVGPITVFYALHEWIFPEKHQWFFYYQESLMTVLMKAPYIFGAIAGIIACLALGIYVLVNVLLHKYLATHTKK